MGNFYTPESTTSITHVSQAQFQKRVGGIGAILEG